jgi:hypothetical protein
MFSAEPSHHERGGSPMSMANGASGPRAISSNFVMPTTPKGSFFQNFVRFTGAGGVHDEDDTVLLGLEVFPARWFRTVARTSKGKTGPIASGHAAWSHRTAGRHRPRRRFSCLRRFCVAHRRGHRVRRLPITRPASALFRLISATRLSTLEDRGGRSLAGTLRAICPERCPGKVASLCPQAVIREPCSASETH